MLSLSVAAFAVISYLSTISEGIFWMEICFCWINNSISHVLPCSPLFLRQGKQNPLKISILHAWFAVGSEKKYKVMFSGCEPAGGCWAHSCSPVSLRLAVSGHVSQMLSFSIPGWREQTGLKPSLLFWQQAAVIPSLPRKHQSCLEEVISPGVTVSCPFSFPSNLNPSTLRLATELWTTEVALEPSLQFWAAAWCLSPSLLKDVDLS